MPRARKYDGVVYRRHGTANLVDSLSGSQRALPEESPARPLIGRKPIRSSGKDFRRETAICLKSFEKARPWLSDNGRIFSWRTIPSRPCALRKRTKRTMRCAKHLKAAFGTSRLVDITADSIELYLRERLRQRVRIKAQARLQATREQSSPPRYIRSFRVLRRMLNVAVRKKLLAANPCSGVEFPVAVKGLFRPHYVTWSEQQRIESHGPQYLRNIVRIITETGLRVYKELTPMKKDQVDLQNAVVWIPDSKTPNGIAEVPLTSLAIEAFRSQMAISGEGPFLFPSDRNPSGHQTTFKTVWRKTLRRAKIPYFRIYDLRSTYATRLSAGGVADEWVTQMLRQSDAQVFKKYSQMKLQMKREALEKLNRRANEMAPVRR